MQWWGFTTRGLKSLLGLTSQLSGSLGQAIARLPANESLPYLGIRASLVPTGRRRGLDSSRGLTAGKRHSNRRGRRRRRGVHARQVRTLKKEQVVTQAPRWAMEGRGAGRGAGGRRRRLSRGASGPRLARSGSSIPSDAQPGHRGRTGSQLETQARRRPLHPCQPHRPHHPHGPPPSGSPRHPCHSRRPHHPHGDSLPPTASAAGTDAGSPSTPSPAGLRGQPPASRPRRLRAARRAAPPTRRRNPSPSCARHGPGRTCAPSSGPSCWLSLRGRLPCPPPDGSWGFADGAAARWLLRPRSRPRPPAAATNSGNVERPGHQ